MSEHFSRYPMFLFNTSRARPLLRGVRAVHFDDQRESR
jgi:hypothetical protein